MERQANRWTMPMTLLVVTVLLSPLFAAEDLMGILQSHDPDAAGVDRSVGIAPASGTATVTASSAADLEKTVAILDRMTKILEELLKIYEKLGLGKTVTDGGSKPKITQGTVQVNTSLNIRTSPWGKIIGSFHQGDKVEIIGKEGDWYKITWNGRTAYCHRNYIEAPGAPAGQVPVKYPSDNGGGSNPAPAPAPAPDSGSRGAFGGAPCSPMPSRASSEYGMRIHPTKGTRSMHYGIDLPVPTGTRLNALGDGVVVAAGFESGGGNYVKIKYDNGYESFYCHLKNSSVRAGQRVSKGQEVARSDNTGIYTTGAHLHFEMKKNGSHVNPRSVPGLTLPR